MSMKLELSFVDFFSQMQELKATVHQSPVGHRLYNFIQWISRYPECNK